MSGQPTPPILYEAFALNATVCTPSSPVAGGKTYPFPTSSQQGIVNGAASLNDGFVALNMTPLTSQGVPPYGVDMNGILYLISANVAALAAGQISPYQSALSTAMGGYALGAVIQDATDSNRFWINQTAGNTNDPASNKTGWRSTLPLYSSATLSGSNDVVLPGTSDYIIDVSASSAAVAFTGFVAQCNGQKVTFVKSDSSSNLITFNSLTGSAAANQLRIPSGGIALALQYDSLTIQYNKTLGYWTKV